MKKRIITLLVCAAFAPLIATVIGWANGSYAIGAELPALEPAQIRALPAGEFRVPERVGEWEGVVGRFPQGALWCSVTLVRSNVQRRFSLLWQEGSGHSQVIMSRNGWAISQVVKVPLRIEVLGGASFVVQVAVAEVDGPRLIFDIPPARQPAFVSSVRAGHTFLVTFDTNVETPGETSFPDGAALMDFMRRCVNAVKAARSGV